MQTQITNLHVDQKMQCTVHVSQKKQKTGFLIHLDSSRITVEHARPTSRSGGGGGGSSGGGGSGMRRGGGFRFRDRSASYFINLF